MVKTSWNDIEFMRIIKSIKMIKTYDDGKKFMKIIHS